MQIVVNELLTQYELSGKGKLVVILHGWGDNSKGVANLQNEIVKTNQVLVLDLPGFGATQAPKEIWGLDNYAGFVDAVIKKLGLKQAYAIIGHSNGGALAIRATARGILKPEKLLLIAASGIRNGGGPRRLALKTAAKIGNAVTLWMPQGYRQALRKRLYRAAGSDMLIVPELQETFKKTVSQDVQEDAASVTVPTLLIYGEKDKATPVSYGRTYETLIKDSHLEVIAGAGHFVHLDQPEQTLKLIKEFLK